MAKLLTWRDDWSLDIEPLDADHRTLIDRLADICLRFCPLVRAYGGIVWPPPALVGDLGAGAAPADLIASLESLGEAAARHFRRTEAFLAAIGYEGIDRHRAEHARQLAQFSGMLEEWRQRGLVVFSEDTQDRVREWLVAHILGGDREFADAYYRLCGVDRRPRALALEEAATHPRIGRQPPGMSTPAPLAASPMPLPRAVILGTC